MMAVGPAEWSQASLHWLRALREPECVRGWSLAEWDFVIRVARRHRLLARLAHAIEAHGASHAVPTEVQRHLLGARNLSLARTRALRWVIERLPAMLDGAVEPLVLLKGAAYLARDLPIAQGRLPSDLDILVPRHKLAEVRVRLRAAGWQEPPLDEHDRRYYLEWSHELPPMHHPRHAVELDVHHNILPPRDGKMPDADLLLARTQPTSWRPWHVLAPVDQVLHSAAHLFYDAEPSDRVRDLVDIDGLLRHFGADAGFWDELPRRAAALGLVEPLTLALEFARPWMGTPVPPTLVPALGAGGPPKAKLRWLRRTMAVVLTPTDPDRADPLPKRLAAVAMLGRYHWHRLPLRLLLPHLWRKFRAKESSDESGPVPARAP